jgi:hypothetical protein
MGNSYQTKYVDADKLAQAISRIYVSAGVGYSSGLLDQQINQLVSNAIQGSLEIFKHQILDAIAEASSPYDKCMLCVQRDSCIPEHPLGENR